MKISTIRIISALILGFVVIAGCKRLDDEPLRAATPISRLYVSFSDYNEGSNSDQKNLAIIDPADTLNLNNIIEHNASIKGGGVVIYSPIASRAFQKSANDTVIRVMSVDDVFGVPSNTGIISNRLFSSGVKDLAYFGDINHDNLYISSYVQNSTPMLYLVRKPANRIGFTRPDKQIALGDIKPISMDFFGKNLVMAAEPSVSNTAGVLAVYKNIVELQSDTIVNANMVVPSPVLTISGSHTLKGIAYSPAHDLLAVAAYTGSGANAVGEIMLFEKASTLFNGGNQTITPTRIISGAGTGLVLPQSVAIDNRSEGTFLYVVDQFTRAVSRFKISDSGNVAPNARKIFDSRTPVSIALDARSLNAF